MFSFWLQLPFLNGKGCSNKELPHVLFASYNCVTCLLHADYSHAWQLQLEHFRSVYKADDSMHHFYLWYIGNINAAYIIKKSQIQFVMQCYVLEALWYIVSVFYRFRVVLCSWQGRDIFHMNWVFFLCSEDVKLLFIMNLFL